MTGAEHYRAAERLVSNVTGGGNFTVSAERFNGMTLELAAAQIHATLAAAAANAERADKYVSSEWADVLE